MSKKLNYLLTILGCLLVCSVCCVDLDASEIKTVTDDDRYIALNPETQLTPFDKVNHAKGNIIFTAGQRISGDHLVLTYLDETQYTQDEDIEVYLRYPSQGGSGATISNVAIYAELTSTDADTYFVAGGVGQNYAEILIVANGTSKFGYQLYLYGY